MDVRSKEQHSVKTHVNISEFTPHHELMWVNSYMDKRDFYVFFDHGSSEDSFIVDNSTYENLHVLYILSEWVYLTVLFLVHLIIVGSILPLNIL